MTRVSAAANIVDLRNRYEPAVHWFSLAPNYDVPIFRNSHLDVIDGLTQYAISLGKGLRLCNTPEAAFKSKMSGLAYALRDFACFLDDKNITWQKITDRLLAEYREWSNQRRISRGKFKDDMSAKRSTNLYLREIYRMLTWCQEEAHLASGLIGEKKCAVRSSLPTETTNSRGARNKTRSRYPLLYKGVGEKSKRGSLNHWATQDDLDQIEERFYEKAKPHIAQRNVTMMHLIDSMAWRVSSIHSLTIQDFVGKLEQTDDGGIIVRPKFQKMGNTFSFTVPFELVRMVLEYITDGRQKIVDRFGGSEQALFLSDTTGGQLSKSAITHIFTGAFDAIGVEAPNAGAHSIRRKSAVDRTDIVYEAREANGLSVGEEDIQFEVSKHLGHESGLAWEAYRKRESRLVDESLGARQQRIIRTKDAENFELRAENERLRTQLARLHGTHSIEPKNEKPVRTRRRR